MIVEIFTVIAISTKMIRANANIDFKLNHQVHEISGLLQPLSNEFINEKHKADKWSIHEIIAHLGRYQEIFEERIKLIVVGDEPKFGRYRADEDGLFTLWVAKGNEQILEDMLNKRVELAMMIRNLSAEDHIKKGTHPVLGTLNIFEWTQFFLYHETNHIYQIFWLIKEFGGSNSGSV